MGVAARRRLAAPRRGRDLVKSETPGTPLASAQVDSIETHATAKCGYAVVANAATHAQDDEMPSFFLAETVKYLHPSRRRNLRETEVP